MPSLIFTVSEIEAAKAKKLTEIRRPASDWRYSRSLGAISPKHHLVDWSRAWVDEGGTIFGPGPYFHVPFAHRIDGWEKDPDDDTSGRVVCKWKVGDELWVKETFCWGTGPTGGEEPTAENSVFVYRADWDADKGSPDHVSLDGAWKPATNMPRFASRFSYRILSVRAEKADVWEWVVGVEAV